MGFLDRLFGRDDTPVNAVSSPNAGAAPVTTYRDGDGRYAPPPAGGSAPTATGDDDQAVERYRYLLRTAPPETIEQVHAEAFAKLTPEQRQQVLADLTSTLPAAERPAGADPQALARAATRAEYSQPGFMERTFANRSFGGGGGLGASFGASMLGTIGGYVIASALVSSFLAPSFAGEQGGQDESSDAGAEGGDGGEGGDAGAEAGGGDVGGGFGGDFGGDFGGGDFGGFDGF